MKVLIHDERSDALEFLWGNIGNYGYRTGIAKDAFEIMSMLLDDRYDVVLTNSGYGDLNQDQHSRIKSFPVFVIGITGPQRRNEIIDEAVDLYLRRPFEASKLKQALRKP